MLRNGTDLVFFLTSSWKGAYELLPKKLTGYVQFDVDSGKYIKSFESREALMSAAWMVPSCHLVVHSFSEHGIWGLIKTSEVKLQGDFRRAALKALEPLRLELGLDLDLSVSVRPHAFRLIPEGMSYFIKNRCECHQTLQCSD